MAEVSFDRLDHRTPLARAEVRHVGDGWHDPLQRVERLDNTTNLPLHSFFPQAPLPPPGPKPEPPSETQLRGTLHECLLARDFASEQLQRAQATHDRAIGHVERCNARLAEFAGLDDEVVSVTIEALRGDGRVDHDPELRHRQAERDIARADAAAAERAERVLAGALADAQADATKAAQAARKAAAAVLTIEAVADAERYQSLMAEAATIRERLAQFDRAVTGSVEVIPQAVLAVLHGVNLMRDIGPGEWAEKLARLLDTEPEGPLPMHSDE